MLKIGELSKLAQVSVKTLRYYDGLGLIRPAWVDRFTGYRYYALHQLPRLNRILALRELGFPLVQIEQLLRDDIGSAELLRLTRLRMAELEHGVQAEQARLARVATRLRQIEQEGRQPRYEVLLKQVQPCLVAGIRDTIAGRDDIGGLFSELQSYLRGRGVAAGPLASCLAVYYDAEYQDRGADVEVAVPVGRGLHGSARVTVHELPGNASVATLVHQGSYERLAAAYGALAAWTQVNGYRAAGPNREAYLQGFVAGDSTAGYVTELQLPVQPVSVQRTIEQKEGQAMEPRIVTKPAFTVVGLPFTGFITNAPYEAGNENNEIGKVWDAFNARIAEVKHVSGPVYGLCFGMPNDKEPWYIAGIEVAREEDVPAGMLSMTVPAQKYAVFPCTLGTLGATYRFISEEWQPRSGHEHADAPDFELYDQELDPENPQQGRLSVYWPIR